MPESPIGSIIAFGGVPNDAWERLNGWLHCDGREFDTSIENDKSALRLAIGNLWGGDGGTRFNIPDLRGYFLRGVDAVPSDPPKLAVDGDLRFASKDLPGGKLVEDSLARPIVPKRVGTFQPFATALPQGDPRSEAVGGGRRSEFKTRTRGRDPRMMGAHVHKVRFQLNAARDVNGQDNTVAFPGVETDEPFVEFSGVHQHDISDGGDLETRPVNASVHWIIRYL